MNLSDKFMRLFVMFDLPTDTKGQRRQATQFRNSLIKRGFYMFQYSIYVKVCNNAEAAKLAEVSVERIIPDEGAVRTMIVTEKQYSNMNILLGSSLYQETFFKDDSLLFF